MYAEEFDGQRLRRIGQRLKSGAVSAAQKGVQVVEQAGKRAAFKAGFAGLARSSQAQLSALQRMRNDVRHGSTIAMNLDDLIKGKQQEVSLLQNLERLA